MKQVRSNLIKAAIILTVIAAVVFLCFPFVDALICQFAKDLGMEPLYMEQFMGNLMCAKDTALAIPGAFMARVQGLLEASPITDFNSVLAFAALLFVPENLIFTITVLVLAFALIVWLITLICHPTGVIKLVLDLVFTVLAFAFVVVGMLPLIMPEIANKAGALTYADVNPQFFRINGFQYVIYGVVALGAVAFILFVLSFFFYQAYAHELHKDAKANRKARKAAKKEKKAAKEAEKAAKKEKKAAKKAQKQAKNNKAPKEVVPEYDTEVVIKEPGDLAAAQEEILNQPTNDVPEQVVEAAVAQEEKPTKYVRRILVHRSGKVVRVLNEHYYDITTNVYIEPGMEEPEDPEETEQMHYEKIIKSSMKEAPAKKPAPVQKPAPEKKAEPAPVVEEPEEKAPAKVKAERIPFPQRLKASEKSVKEAYNEIKADLLSYGLKSRISSTGDTFRLHTKEYAKIVIAGKGLKIYFALNPKDYKNSTIPVNDAGKMVAHKETPLVFKVKSDLSVRRAKQLIIDVTGKDKLEQGEVVKHDYAKEVK